MCEIQFWKTFLWPAQTLTFCNISVAARKPLMEMSSVRPLAIFMTCIYWVRAAVRELNCEPSPHVPKFEQRYFNSRYTLIYEYKPDNSQITSLSLHLVDVQRETWTTDSGRLHNTTGVSNTREPQTFGVLAVKRGMCEHLRMLQIKPHYRTEFFTTSPAVSLHFYILQTFYTVVRCKFILFCCKH